MARYATNVRLLQPAVDQICGASLPSCPQRSDGQSRHAASTACRALQTNHNPPKPGIQKRKKARLSPWLSCNNDSLPRADQANLSPGCRFFTGDKSSGLALCLFGRDVPNDRRYSGPACWPPLPASSLPHRESPSIRSVPTSSRNLDGKEKLSAAQLVALPAAIAAGTSTNRPVFTSK